MAAVAVVPIKRFMVVPNSDQRLVMCSEEHARWDRHCSQCVPSSPAMSLDTECYEEIKLRALLSRTLQGMSKVAPYTYNSQGAREALYASGDAGGLPP